MRLLAAALSIVVLGVVATGCCCTCETSGTGGGADFLTQAAVASVRPEPANVGGAATVAHQRY